MSSFSTALDRNSDDASTATNLSLASLTARLAAWFKPAPASNPIEDFINANGGVLTDSIERRIGQHFSQR